MLWQHETKHRGWQTRHAGSLPPVEWLTYGSGYPEAGQDAAGRVCAGQAETQLRQQGKMPHMN